MSRWLTRILICLLLGGVTTVAVAWLCALIHDSALQFRPGFELYGFSWDGTSIHDFRLESGIGWRYLAHGRTEWPRGRERAAESFGVDDYIPHHATPRHICRMPREGESFLEMEFSYGFPLTSMCYSLLHPNPSRTDTSNNGWLVRGEGWIDFGQRPRGSIPLIPLSMRFAIDVAFYGALWLGLIVGFSAARRGLRKKRGRCPMCAYDLRGDLDRGCPECGWNRAEAEA